MGAPRLNVQVLRARRAELGLSVRAIAAEAGLTGNGYVALEKGYGHDALSYGTVVRLARVLGLTLDELVADKPASNEEEDDAAALGVLLYSIGTLTPVGALTEVLDWPLDRLHRAEGELARRLEGVGARLRRSGARLAVVPANDAVDAKVLEAALRRHLGRDHVKLTEARMLRHVEHDDVPTQPSNPERVAMGVLVNAGLVAFGEPPTKTAEAPLVLSEDVRFSLMLEEDPNDEGTAPRRRRRSPVTRSSKTG